MKQITLLSVLALIILGAASCKDSRTSSQAPDYSMSYTVKGVSFEMLKFPAGNFTMGISADNRRKVTRGIAQPVALDGFVISAEPVSQALWTEVMGKNPSGVQNPSAPVDMVSWADIQKFLSKSFLLSWALNIPLLILKRN